MQEVYCGFMLDTVYRPLWKRLNIQPLLCWLCCHRENKTLLDIIYMSLKCEMDTKPKQNYEKTLLNCHFEPFVGCFGILETGQK